LNTATKELWFRRGYTGEGIGHVTVCYIVCYIYIISLYLFCMQLKTKFDFLTNNFLNKFDDARFGYEKIYILFFVIFFFQKNPIYDHIAVGENGNKPPIIIYEWPSMYIITILYNGTLKRYSHLTYRYLIKN